MSLKTAVTDAWVPGPGRKVVVLRPMGNWLSPRSTIASPLRIRLPWASPAATASRSPGARRWSMSISVSPGTGVRSNPSSSCAVGFAYTRLPSQATVSTPLWMLRRMISASYRTLRSSLVSDCRSSPASRSRSPSTATTTNTVRNTSTWSSIATVGPVCRHMSATKTAHAMAVIAIPNRNGIRTAYVAISST